MAPTAVTCGDPSALSVASQVVNRFGPPLSGACVNPPSRTFVIDAQSWTGAASWSSRFLALMSLVDAVRARNASVRPYPARGSTIAAFEADPVVGARKRRASAQWRRAPTQLARAVVGQRGSSICDYSPAA